jgi:hypothetical protein
MEMYDELVQMVQNGEITLVEFICKQDDLKQEYIKFLSERKLEKNSQTAQIFLDWYENTYVMN